MGSPHAKDYKKTLMLGGITGGEGETISVFSAGWHHWTL